MVLVLDESLESRCLKGIPKSLETYTRQVQGPPEKLEDHYKTSTGATREARRSQDKYRGHQRSKKLSTRQVQGPPEKQKDRSTQGKYRGHQRSKKITTRQEQVQGPPEKQEDSTRQLLLWQVYMDVPKDNEYHILLPNYRHYVLHGWWVG